MKKIIQLVALSVILVSCGNQRFTQQKFTDLKPIKTKETPPQLEVSGENDQHYSEGLKNESYPAQDVETGDKEEFLDTLSLLVETSTHKKGKFRANVKPNSFSVKPGIIKKSRPVQNPQQIGKIIENDKYRLRVVIFVSLALFFAIAAVVLSLLYFNVIEILALLIIAYVAAVIAQIFGVIGVIEAIKLSKLDKELGDYSFITGGISGGISSAIIGLLCILFSMVAYFLL